MVWFVGNRGTTGFSGTRASWARVPSYFFNSLFPCHGARWIKKHSTRAHQARVPKKGGTLLYSSETVFLSKLFSKLMVMGHFCLKMYWLYCCQRKALENPPAKEHILLKRGNLDCPSKLWSACHMLSLFHIRISLISASFPYTNSIVFEACCLDCASRPCTFNLLNIPFLSLWR